MIIGNMREVNMIKIEFTHEEMADLIMAVAITITDISVKETAKEDYRKLHLKLRKAYNLNKD